MLRLPWLAPIVLTAYVLLASGAGFALRWQLPSPLDMALQLFLAPLLLLFQPLYVVFRPLGLLSGEAWTLPSPVGLVVGTLFYDLVLWGLGWGYLRWRG